MPLETPRLDDRAFEDIVTEARSRIQLYCPEWTDHNLSDPGITLLELFAWMTDIILYRMNRVPEKHFIKFMEILGIRLQGSDPARAPVTFWLSAPPLEKMTINADTEVATTRTETEEAIIFTTDAAAEILVPEMKYVMTSSDAEEGRRFTGQNVASLLNGNAEMFVFSSTPPANGDALYIGFDQDLSNHIIAINLEVDAAEGAGVDPNNPPYIFEVLGQQANQNWVKVDVDMDSTLALNVNGMLRLFLPQLRSAPRNDINAYWVRMRLNVEEGQAGYGISPTIRRLTVDSWGITMDTTNLTRVRNETLGRSEGKPGQQFYLINTPVIARTPNEYVIVRLEDGREERWAEVADFASSTLNDRHYTLDSQTGELRFGPALPQRDGTIRRYGAIPDQNSVLVMTGYRYGGGLRGNVAASTVNVLKSALPYIAKVANRVAARGGLDGEHLEDAKQRVPDYLRSLNRAVTAADFEYLAHQSARGQIARAYCLQPPLTNRGEIKVLIIPSIPNLEGFISPESLTLSDELRQRVNDYLDERRLLSTLLEVLPPAYQWVETEVRFRAGRGVDLDQARRAVESRLYHFLNPITGGPDGTGWQFGRDLYVADVMSVLLSVPGVDIVRSVKLYPVAYADSEFIRGAEVEELPIVAHGTIVSYRHNVRTE